MKIIIEHIDYMNEFRIYDKEHEAWTMAYADSVPEAIAGIKEQVDPDAEIVLDDSVIQKLFEEMRNDINCMAEYGDDEAELLQELKSCGNEILKEYASIYLN